MSWSQLTRNQKVYTVTAILTGLMHLAFASNFSSENAFGINLALLFVVNGIGFLVVIILLSFTEAMVESRSLMKLFLIVWGLGSIIGWLMFHPGTTYFDSSLSNKIIEVIMLVFLGLDMREA